METNVKITWQYQNNGMFALLWGDIAVLTGYAKAYHVDGRVVDTRTAVLKKQEMTHDERGVGSVHSCCGRKAMSGIISLA